MALHRQTGPTTADEPESCYDLDLEDRTSRLGLFYYKHDGGLPIGSDEFLLDRYRRLVVPEDPLHINQLPPDLRSKCRTIRFVKATFAGNEHLQPLDDHPCTMWNPDGAIAYLAADRATVRPTPGHEDEFADFCSRLLQEYPKFAGRLRFEAAPKKRGKSKRKGPGGKQ